jgi:hypothetical protein
LGAAIVITREGHKNLAMPLGVAGHLSSSLKPFKVSGYYTYNIYTIFLNIKTPHYAHTVYVVCFLSLYQNQPRDEYHYVNGLQNALDGHGKLRSNGRGTHRQGVTAQILCKLTAWRNPLIN